MAWWSWVYGRQQISQPTTETVYYYNENPASKWSIWSSVVKVDVKNKIPTASGAYEVRDLTEQTESGYWGEWIGFEYEASVGVRLARQRPAIALIGWLGVRRLGQVNGGNGSGNGGVYRLNG